MSKMRASAILLAAIIVFTLTGCVGVNFYAVGNSVVGKGATATRSYEPGSFDSVEISGEFELVYRNSQSCRVELEMQENLFEYVRVSVSNGRLIVDSDENIRSGNNQINKVYVYMPELKGLSSSGAVVFKDADAIKGERFDIDIAGAGTVDITLEVESFSADMSGAGTITLSGTAKNAKIEMAGAGNVDALALDTTNAEIIISGTGNGSISCSGKLTANISGVGNLEYKGDPEVTERVSGMGSVKKAD